MRPAVLFARADSFYKTLDCDVWDADRDARKWPGGSPVVAHPPCRSWGSLRYFAKPAPGERELAPWAVDQVRNWGGCLEHPAASVLWREAALPEPGERDAWGGFTLVFPQWWFGHRAEKMTRLYVCGIDPRDVPEMPLRIGEASHVIARSAGGRAGRVRKGDPRWRPEVTPAEREHTPPLLAHWLLELASRCKPARTAAAA